MTFPPDADSIARESMSSIDPTLVDAYANLIKFLASYPAAASAMRGKSAPSIGSKLYIERRAASFAAARKHRAPSPPETVPDEMVSLILQEYFKIPISDLARVKAEHLLSMGAENLVGELLERYIATIAEPRGWIWCSGSIVKAIDFIKPPTKNGEDWNMLQIKNRDNSENSSSKLVRLNTLIEKWHRTFSQKTGSNWAAFPDDELRQHLSEAGFKSYVKNYLQALRT